MFGNIILVTYIFLKTKTANLGFFLPNFLFSTFPWIKTKSLLRYCHIITFCISPPWYQSLFLSIFASFFVIVWWLIVCLFDSSDLSDLPFFYLSFRFLFFFLCFCPSLPSSLKVFCLFICLSVVLSVWLSVYLYVWVSVCLST